MSRPLMWVGVAYTLGVIWAAGDQKLFYGTAGIVLFVWITGRIRQPWKEKRLFWLLPVFFVSGFVIFDHAMTDVKDASMENQFIHTRGMICQSEAKEKTLAVTLSDADINGRKKKLLLYMEKDAPVAVGDDIEVRGILEKPERALEQQEILEHGYGITIYDHEQDIYGKNLEKEIEDDYEME